MKSLAVTRTDGRGAIEIAEMVMTAAVSLLLLGLCALLSGCSLTHVEARPAPRAATVAVVGIDSRFGMPMAMTARLRDELATSLADQGHVVVDVADAACQVIAIVEREYHDSRVGVAMHSQTEYEYGTYHVRLVVVDPVGKKLGEVRTDRDEFLSTLRAHPEREEQLIVEGLRRAATFAFARPQHANDLGVLRASR